MRFRRQFALILVVLIPWSFAEGALPTGERGPDVLQALPSLPNLVLSFTDPIALGEVVAPGVHMVRGERVCLDTTVNLDKGPADGLEVFACLPKGKTHEALLRLDSNNGQWIKFACIAALGPPDGMTAPETSGLPARGTPLRIRAMWQDEDGKTRIIDGSSLVRDRVIDHAYPPLPFIYTGSRFQSIQEAGPNGVTKRREMFMLDSTASVVVNFDEPDALFASPFPGAREDYRFEVNSALAPAAGTAVELVIEKADLPLTLDQDETGGLKAQGDPEALNDQRLSEALGLHYPGGLPAETLRAVGVRVKRSTDRQLDVANRARLLAAAATAKVWVVPVFIVGNE